MKERHGAIQRRMAEEGEEKSGLKLIKTDSGSQMTLSTNNAQYRVLFVVLSNLRPKRMFLKAERKFQRP